MKRTIVTNRRQILRGAGGLTLTLPFLPSLAVPARSYADAVPARRKRFFAFCNNHGGVHPSDMFPLAAASQSMDMFPGHTIKHGKLVRTVSGGTATISPVLSAPDTLLTDAMASKINIIRGLDYGFYLSHHGGGYLGNIAGNDGVAGGEQLIAQKSPNVTIDQQMAWSPTFYAGAVPRKRFIYRWGYSNASHCYTWSSPTSRSGNIDMVRGETNLGNVFDSLFMGGVTAPPPPAAPRPLIVDKVFVAYKSLRDGNARLSVSDKQRLTDHMSRLDELQRKIKATQKPVVPPAACKAPVKNTQNIDWHVAALNYYQLYNDLVAAAFVCDTTRIVVEGFEGEHEPFINYPGGGSAWHQDVAHQYGMSGPRLLLMQQSQSMFANLMLDLARKLEVDEGDGSTVLDNSLLFWSQEAGCETHVPLSIPVVTIGSAGGYFNTGNYVDFRRDGVAAAYYSLNHDNHYAGIMYNRMMSNVLDSMGVDRAEWLVPDKPGFGQTLLANAAKSRYSAAVLAAGNDPLPIITRG